MGFNRVLLSADGKLPQPMRAGVGMLANFSMTVFGSQADATLKMSELSGGHIFQDITLSSDVVYTLPTGTQIQAEKGFDAMDIGDAYSFVVTNSQVASWDVVIAVDTGVTAIGANNTLSVPPQCSRIFTLVKTGDNTFDLY